MVKEDGLSFYNVEDIPNIFKYGTIDNLSALIKISQNMNKKK